MNNEEVRFLIHHRVTQAKDTLKEARCLLNEKMTPAGVVNRGYYAMFYASLAILQTIGKIPSKHTGVISLFNREFVLIRPRHSKIPRGKSIPLIPKEFSLGIYF